MTQARRFACEPGSVPQARRFVIELVRDEADELVQGTALMVSELATNCVLHANTAFEVTVELSQAELRVEVGDEGTGMPQVRPLSPQTAQGRGLHIIEEFSDSWGVSMGPDGHGKSVWFSLARKAGASLG